LNPIYCCEVFIPLDLCNLFYQCMLRAGGLDVLGVIVLGILRHEAERCVAAAERGSERRGARGTAAWTGVRGRGSVHRMVEMSGVDTGVVLVLTRAWELTARGWTRRSEMQGKLWLA
jgi:hypothetical protein